MQKSSCSIKPARSRRACLRSLPSTTTRWTKQKLLEYAALAECASSHPISKSLQKAYGKEIDRSRVNGH